MTTIDELEPRTVLHYFQQLSEIPRGSENERAVSDWIRSYAESLDLDVEQDELHNVLVRKPGTHGFTDAPTLILHGHMDMVCEKVEGSDHDFETDPIRLLVDGDDITADGTSLGADNGIGVSYILALLGSTDLPHPPLEAVITVMEEKGKVGAAHFDTTRLRGSRMIDFNWITDDEILAGCGGDLTMTVDIVAETAPVPSDSAALEIGVRGLRGGHCEFDVHLERANAIVLLGRALGVVADAYPMRIVTFDGGAQNNVIPSEATALVIVPRDQVNAIFDTLRNTERTLRSEFAVADPNLRIDVAEIDIPATCQSRTVTEALRDLVTLIPDGVVSWSLVTPGIVESSNNLGTVRTEGERFRFMTTITAGVTSRKHFIARQITQLARRVGGVANEYGLDAPEFPFNPNSSLLSTAHDAYRAATGTQARTLVSNCSLELGMFTQRLPGLDTISVGTNLSGLHSPDERVSHRSVAKVWPFVKELVGRLDR